MVVREQLYTADDLWKMSNDDVWLELDEGVLIEMSPTGDIHGILTAWVTYLIVAFVMVKDLGYVTGAETGYILFPNRKTVRAPDIGYISKVRQTVFTGKFFPIPPDMAVEIVSPSETASQIRKKVAQYLKAGTRLVWVIYPEERLVDVYKPGQDPHPVGIDGTLDGGDALLGFSVTVKEIFAKLPEEQ